MELCMPHPHVVVERSAADYLRLLLSRPDRRNALDPGMVRALLEAFGAEPEALVLLGSTDPRAFCAGADLVISDAQRTEVSDLLYQCYEVMITRPGPVIAVIRGAAVGGGAQLATAAGLRVAAAGPGRPWRRDGADNDRPLGRGRRGAPARPAAPGRQRAGAGRGHARRDPAGPPGRLAGEGQDGDIGRRPARPAARRARRKPRSVGASAPFESRMSGWPSAVAVGVGSWTLAAAAAMLPRHVPSTNRATHPRDSR